MRKKTFLALTLAGLATSTSGCYVDGRMQMPTWETMSAVWRRPGTANNSAAIASTGTPGVAKPSDSQTPGRDLAAGGVNVSPGTQSGAPGTQSAPAANAVAGGATAQPATNPYATTNANFVATPGQYPDTGKQAIQASANMSTHPASPASHTAGAAVPGATYNPATATAQNPYVQQGAYSPAYGQSNGGGASATPAAPPTGSPQAPPSDRYVEDYAPQRPAADQFVPQRQPVDARQADSRPTAPRPTAPTGPIRPGDTGYRPAETGYNPPQPDNYARATNTETQIPSANGPAANGSPVASSAPPVGGGPVARTAAAWSPAGTGRYQAGPANVSVNPYARDAGPTTAPPMREAARPRETMRSTEPAAPARPAADPYAPESPAPNATDPSRYDSME